MIVSQVRQGSFKEEGTYTDELVQEDTAKVGAGGNVKREDACGAVSREHYGVELASGREDLRGFLHVQSGQSLCGECGRGGNVPQ